MSDQNVHDDNRENPDVEQTGEVNDCSEPTGGDTAHVDLIEGSTINDTSNDNQESINLNTVLNDENVNTEQTNHVIENERHPEFVHESVNIDSKNLVCNAGHIPNETFAEVSATLTLAALTKEHKNIDNTSESLNGHDVVSQLQRDTANSSNEKLDSTTEYSGSDAHATHYYTHTTNVDSTDEKRSFRNRANDDCTTPPATTNATTNVYDDRGSETSTRNDNIPLYANESNDPIPDTFSINSSDFNSPSLIGQIDLQKNKIQNSTNVTDYTNIDKSNSLISGNDLNTQRLPNGNISEQNQNGYIDTSNIKIKNFVHFFNNKSQADVNQPPIAEVNIDSNNQNETFGHDVIEGHRMNSDIADKLANVFFNMQCPWENVSNEFSNDMRNNHIVYPNTDTVGATSNECITIYDRQASGINPSDAYDASPLGSVAGPDQPTHLLLIPDSPLWPVDVQPQVPENQVFNQNGQLYDNNLFEDEHGNEEDIPIPNLPFPSLNEDTGPRGHQRKG